MVQIKQITGAKGLNYSDAPQKSPEWVAIRTGKVGASDLGRWLAVGVKGQPLKARQDLERELAFEKAFKTPFSRFVTGAMQQGIDNEDFVRDQYSSLQGVVVEKAGCFYNEHFVASPDGLVGDDGLLEIKWLQDASWTEVVVSGKPIPDHYSQMQGQLWASGRKWVDYVVGNGNTNRFKVIRVKRDEEEIARIAESVTAVVDIAPLETENVFEFSGVTPAVVEEISKEVVWA